MRSATTKPTGKNKLEAGSKGASVSAPARATTRDHGLRHRAKHPCTTQAAQKESTAKSRSEARFRVSCLPERTLPFQRTARGSPAPSEPPHPDASETSGQARRGHMRRHKRASKKRAHQETTETKGHMRRPPTEATCGYHELTTATAPMDQSQHRGYGQTKSCALIE